MGVQGKFFGYLRKHDLSKSINFNRRAIRSWLRHKLYPSRKPIIVIDFKSFVYSLARRNRDVICGGRHQIIQQIWRKVLKTLKENTVKDRECELVFFSDWIITESKIEKWMERDKQNFERCVKFYNAIDDKEHFAQIKDEITKLDMKPLNSMFYDLEIIAREYGTLYYSVDRENDVELARHATDNNALVVISNDSDFLIFRGDWEFVSLDKNEPIREDSVIKVIHHKRHGLREVLNLKREDMPLFATVLGNDFFNERIFKSIDDAAAFARNKSLLSTDEIISQLPSRKIDKEKFQNSLNSYNIDFDDEPINGNDPYEQTLRENGHKMYRFYKALLGPIHGISLPFYDMKENNPRITLPELIIGWTRRKIGILHDHKHKRGESHTFSVIAKKKFDEPFSCLKYTAEYPKDISLPELDQLYSENESPGDLIETKWNILKWIMSFAENEISTIRKTKKEFRMIGAILCALIKENLLDEKEADGILCTEYENSSGIKDNVVIPTKLNSQCVRAAHKYNNVFSHVREIFLIAGLSSYIEESMKFDGNYFQVLMIQFMQHKDEERHDHMQSIKTDVMSDGESKFDLF